jgi:hypothetical protein
LPVEINIIIGVVTVAIGIALAFAKVDPDEIRFLKYFSPLASLHQYPLWRYGISALVVAAGLFLVFSAATS